MLGCLLVCSAHLCCRGSSKLQHGCYLQVELLSKHTEHDQEKIAKDILRPKYFDPHAAIEYNLIDRVLEANELGVRDAVREASKFS